MDDEQISQKRADRLRELKAKASLMTVLQCLATIFLYSVGVFIMGLAIFPGAIFCGALWERVAVLGPAPRLLALSLPICCCSI